MPVDLNDLRNRAASVWRDFVTAGSSGSGAHNPDKAAIRLFQDDVVDALEERALSTDLASVQSAAAAAGASAAANAGAINAVDTRLTAAEAAIASGLGGTTLNAPEWINPLVDTTFTENEAITAIDLTARVSDSDTPLASLTFAASGLPTGFSMNSGVITGTPTAIGTYTVDYSVSDGNTTVPKRVTFTVAPAGASTLIAPRWLNPLLDRTDVVGQIIAIDLKLRVTDEDGDVNNLTFAESNLPAGLNLTSGVIGGTLTTNGTYAVTITATDQDGQSSDFLFNWTVVLPFTIPDIVLPGNFLIGSSNEKLS